MKSRHVSKVIGLLVIISIFLSACAAAAPATNDAPAASEGAAAVAPKGEFPIVTDKEQLKILIGSTNGVSSYEVNDYTQWLEEQTGLDLVFDVAPWATSPEAKQKLNLVLASGELPDVIMNLPMPLADQQTLADQGLIIPVDDLIAEYGDEFAQVMSDMPQIREATALSDGKMYSLPEINDCYHCSFSQKAWIYKPWLDALGLEVPTTTDELYTVLKAFKEQDPNGNGIADEIPWSASVSNGWHPELDSFIMNSFVLNPMLSNDQHMFVEDGKIKAAYAEEGWKEGMLFLNKLYSEGLIDPEAFTNDNTQLKGIAENPDTPVLGFVQEGWPGMFLDWGGPSGRWEDYVPIAPLKGPSGLQQTPNTPYQAIATGRYVITSAAANPAAAFRLADLMYSYEATQRNVFGRPGFEWEPSAEGAEAIDGGQAKYKVLTTYNEAEQAISWNQAAPNYRSVGFPTFAGVQRGRSAGATSCTTGARISTLPMASPMSSFRRWSSPRNNRSAWASCGRHSRLNRIRCTHRLSPVRRTSKRAGMHTFPNLTLLACRTSWAFTRQPMTRKLPNSFKVRRQPVL